MTGFSFEFVYAIDNLRKSPMKILLKLNTSVIRWASCLALVATLAACGGGSDDNSTIPPVERFELTAQIRGAGSVQSSPAGLDCSNECVVAFDVSTTVSLTPTPATGFRFVGWGDACTGTGSCVVTMDQARRVSAAFDPIPGAQNFTLTVSVTGNGSISSQPAGINCASDCSEVYPANTVVTLTATPATNQSFSGWSGACSGASSCVVTMNQVNAVSASFAPIAASQFTLTTSVTGNGRITSTPAGIDCGSTCDAAFNAGVSVTLTAAPAAGQLFNGWSGACTGTQTTCVLQLSQARSAQANFVIAPPAAKAWQAAELLETSNDFNVDGTNTFSSANMLTAIGPNGDVMVLWEQSDGIPDGSTRKVFSRRYTPSSGWQANIDVPGLSTSSSSVALLDGVLFMDSTGIATWVRLNKETRRNSASTGWATPFTIPPVTVGRADPGSISSAVMDANGNISILISGSDVYNIALNAGQSQWGNWARLDTSGNLVARDARVAISSNGTALAVWRESNPGDSNYSLKSSRYTTTDGWSAPASIETLFTNVLVNTPRIAMDASGNGIALWAQGSDLYYNVYRSGSGWQGAVAVDAGQVGSIGNVAPQIAMTPDGRAVAAWSIGLATLRTMQYDPVSGWSTPITVDSYNLEKQLFITDAGQATLVYIPPINQTTANFDVVARSLVLGGVWSAPVLLESAAGNVKSTSFVMNRSGQGITVFVQNDIVNSGVRNSLWGALLR
jgi:Divergent InlB B-repeat domain